MLWHRLQASVVCYQWSCKTPRVGHRSQIWFTIQQEGENLCFIMYCIWRERREAKKFQLRGPAAILKIRVNKQISQQRSKQFLEYRYPCLVTPLGSALNKVVTKGNCNCADDLSPAFLCFMTKDCKCELFLYHHHNCEQSLNEAASH